MARFKANREIRYGGRSIFQNDEFEAPDDDRDLRVLEKLGRVTKTVTTRGRRAPYRTAAEEATSSPTPVVGDYDRRDMRAREETTRRQAGDADEG